MKIKEIGTVSAAAALTLGAVVLLNSEPPTRSAAPSLSHETETFAFNDTSRIIEFASPDPSAEPPLENEEIFDVNGDEMSQSESAAPESTSLAGVNDLDEPVPTFEQTFAEAIEEASAGETTSETPTTSSPQAVEEVRAEPLIEETAGGFWLRDAKLNDVFQHLAQQANLQFLQNAELSGPNFVVTGQLLDDDPVRQMEEIGLQYGVTIHRKGNTIYALTNAQLSTLPTQPFRYQLKYLRPSDIDQIKLILQPLLTPGSGIIEYETKTNTLIVLDNERKLDDLAEFLHQIDRPKQQVAIETRILRITSNSRNRVGVDWSSVLGDEGLSLGGTASLNSLFNLPDMDTVTHVVTSTINGTIGRDLQVVPNNGTFEAISTQNRTDNLSELVLSPVSVNAVLRALNVGGLAQQESSPTLITEDNEAGLISIIDRVPIITATVSETDAGQNITEEVRYRIDTDDPVGDPATTREIGVTVSVTPTILPDNTIRMSLRPRSAQIVEFVQGRNGTSYPRVNESTVTTTARVPNGHSLLIGGFYEVNESDGTNKVPVLGDLPALNLLFKSSDKQKNHTSLVFIVTPRLYQPANFTESDRVSHEIHDSHVLPSDHDYPDRHHPGTTYKTDFKTTANNVFNRYEPEAPSHLLHPEHPYNNPNTTSIQKKAISEYGQPSATATPTNRAKRNGGFFKKIFRSNQAN